MSRYKRGMAAKNGLYFHYVGSARRRGLAFTLRRAKFFSLISSNCEYCGVAPQQVWTRNLSKFTEPLIYNGVDRVDNNVGYIYGNVVTCCKQCNYAKNDLTGKEWSEYIDRLVKFASSSATFSRLLGAAG